MKVSKDDLELIEKIKEYRQDIKKLELLDFKNQTLEKQNNELKQNLKELHRDIIDQKRILKQISNLKSEKIRLNKKLTDLVKQFDLVVTTPSKAQTVYGEIRTNLKNAKKEVLVCSPWITYLVEEFAGFKGKVKLKIITTLREEDIKKGITSVDKLRVLMELGSQIRYNNNLHAKMVFIDSKTAIISSANLTQKGLSVNYEAGVIIKEPQKVQKAIEFFHGVWEESKILDEDKLIEIATRNR